MNKTSLKQTPLSKLQADKQRLHLLCRIQEQKLNEEVLYMRENAGRLLFSGISALFSTSGSSKSEKKKTNAIIKEMSQEFSSSSSMNLRGIKDVRSWSVDKDDYEVVGVIRYYSRDSIEAANEKFNPKTQTNEKKSNKKATPGVKKSNNLSVDDF